MSFSVRNNVERPYTTTQVAKLVSVAPRTVCRWVDSGLLEGFRVPGSKDRRITGVALYRFILKHNMPMPDEIRQFASDAVAVQP